MIKTTPEYDRRETVTNERLSDALRNLSTVAARSQIAGALGQSFGGDRDIYSALGYEKTPTFKMYMARYKRQDMARAVIEAPPDECWKSHPQIVESERDIDDDPTEFELAFSALAREIRLFSVFKRADRMSRIGQYSVLLLGTGDGADTFEAPAERASELLYIEPYDEANATILTSITDQADPRYGKPETYSVKIRTGATSSDTVKVHWTRIIHVVEDQLENTICGQPALQSILNTLTDLERVSGGSAEGYWRGAAPGYNFKIDPKGNVTKTILDEMGDDIEEYVHGYKRYLRTQGIDVQSLAPQVADPSKHVEVYTSLIAAATRIPKRILLGSERGELASSQDERAWRDRMGDRRRNYCEPQLVRQFTDRMIEIGVLPSPSSEAYDVEWPDLHAASDRDKAEIGEIRARAAALYANSQNIASVMPIEAFYELIIGASREDAERILGAVEAVAPTTPGEDGDGE